MFAKRVTVAHSREMPRKRDTRYHGGVPATPEAAALYALRLTDPSAYREKIKATLSATKSVAEAAKKLGMGRRSLERRLAEDPSLRDGISLPIPGAGSHKTKKKRPLAKRVTVT